MLTDQRDQLERRLDDGWAKIAFSEKERKDIRAWEDFWIDLLAEYERVCDLIDEKGSA